MSPKSARPNQAERDEMARLLPVPAERDLPGGRHYLLKDYVMREIRKNDTDTAALPAATGWQSFSRNCRRHLGVRLAIPTGLAAGAAGIALTALPVQTAAAYTLQDSSGGTVKLTINNSAGTIDLDRLQSELDELGVPSRVYAGDPTCRDASVRTTPAPDASSSSSAPSASQSEPQAWDISVEDGKPVLTIRSDGIPATKRLMVVFPLAKTDPRHAYSVITAGVVSDSEAPECVPAAPPGAIEYHESTAFTS